MREIAKVRLAMCRSRYQASRRAKLILVPATVAAAENVRGGLAQARPSGFLQIPAPYRTSGNGSVSVRSVVAPGVSAPAAGFHVKRKRVTGHWSSICLSGRPTDRERVAT